MVSLVVHVCMGLLFIGIAVPLIQRRVAPNHLYGYRTRKTLSDERIWYAANEYSGKTLAAAGIGLTIGAILLSPLLLWPGTGERLYETACFLLLVTLLVRSLVVSANYVRKL